MIYFAIAGLVILYLEVFGQVMLHLFGKKMLFGFSTGTITWLAAGYLSSCLLTALNCSFRLICIIYAVLFVSSIILIIRCAKEIKWKFSPFHWALLVGSVLFLTWFSAHTSLGDMDGFDTTFYANLVCGNIGLSRMNTISPYFGTETEPLQYMYTFQSYYYLASVLVYFSSFLCRLLEITYYYMPAYFWVFQILYFMMVNALLIMSVHNVKKHRIPVAILIFGITQLYFQKLYFNNVFGFYGNTFRTMLFGYGFLFLHQHLHNADAADKYLFGMTLLAACAVSSSSVFIMIALLLAVFFVALEDHPQLFKEYAVILFLPLINFIAVFTESLLYSLIGGLLFSMILWFGNHFFYRLFIQRRNRKVLLTILAILMACLSLHITRNPFDFSAFFVNGAELYDMSINYFNYYYMSRAKHLYAILCIMLAVGSILFAHHERIVMIPTIVFIIFLNPFCCPVLLKFNSVYSRMYDLIWNPFTLVIYTSFIFRKAKRSFLPMGISAAVTILFCLIQNIAKPIYYHPHFLPEEHYNWIYRMSDQEFDIIQQMSQLMAYDTETDERIITENKLTLPMLNRGIYYLARQNRISQDWSDAEKQLYWLFYPDRYTSNDDIQEPDYDHACDYLAEAKIDYLVVDKTVLYFNSEFKGGTWVEANYFINECGTYPAYENERYALYRFAY